VVLKKVATSCRAATAFLSAALGIRQGKDCGAHFFDPFFLRKKKGYPSAVYICFVSFLKKK